MKNVILLGAPGSGKGTQSDRLIHELHYFHLSTGDIIRDNIKNQTAEGLACQSYLESGTLVPDSIIIKMVANLISTIKQNIVWDGFPRTVAQAKALDNMLSEQGHSITNVILLTIPDSELLIRLTGRLTCPNCKLTYHLQYKPPVKKGICDNCKTELIQRSDDNLEKAQIRLQVYKKETAPLVDFYEEQKKLARINGAVNPTTVWSQICEVLNG